MSMGQMKEKLVEPKTSKCDAFFRIGPPADTHFIGLEGWPSYFGSGYARYGHNVAQKTPLTIKSFKALKGKGK